MVDAERERREHDERRVRIAVDDLPETRDDDGLQFGHAHVEVHRRIGPVPHLAPEAARHRLRGLRVEGPERIRAVGAVAARMDVDEARVERVELVVAQPELGGHTAAETGDEHIGLGHDAMGDGPTLGRAQIHREALLARRGLVRGDVLAERHAMRIAVRVLDLDHAGTECSGHRDAVGHRVEVAELDDGDAGERV